MLNLSRRSPRSRNPAILSPPEQSFSGEDCVQAMRLSITKEKWPTRRPAKLLASRPRGQMTIDYLRQIDATDKTFRAGRPQPGLPGFTQLSFQDYLQINLVYLRDLPGLDS